MSEAVATSASELIGGNATVKKQRAPWPDGVPLVEVYPGSKLYRHPVDKAMIKPADAIALGAKWPMAVSAAPIIEIKAEPTPTPQPEPQPQPTPNPQPEQKPTPDFSDLPPGNGNAAPREQQQEQTGNPADALKSHRALGEIIHRMIEMLCVLVFGTDFQTNDGERNALIQAWADAFEWWQISVFNPAEQLAAAYSAYFFARIGAVMAWFKNRKKKKQPPATEQPPITVEAEVTPGKPPEAKPESKTEAKAEPQEPNVFGV